MVGRRVRLEQLDFPDAITPVAPALLEDGDVAVVKPRWEAAAELLGRAVQVGVGAPADIASVEEHLLRPQLSNHRRVSGDPHTSGCHIEKQRVEIRAIGPVLNRIDPDEYAVQLQQLVSSLLDGTVLEHDRAKRYGELLERLIQRCESVARIRNGRTGLAGV